MNDWWEPRCQEIPGYHATVRQDTRQVLGIVGERYRIVQNEEAFQFVDQLLGSSLHFETAGSLHGGRRVWVLATLPEHIQVGGDPARPYVLLMNSHDGSTAVIAATTPIGVVCQNTLNFGPGQTLAELETSLADAGLIKVSTSRSGALAYLSARRRGGFT